MTGAPCHFASLHQNRIFLSVVELFNPANTASIFYSVNHLLEKVSNVMFVHIQKPVDVQVLCKSRSASPSDQKCQLFFWACIVTAALLTLKNGIVVCSGTLLLKKMGTWEGKLNLRHSCVEQEQMHLNQVEKLYFKIRLLTLKHRLISTLWSSSGCKRVDRG